MRMNNLQLHFGARCSRGEEHRKELGEVPSHLLTKWNNQEHSEQEWSSNLFYLGDKWNRKQQEDKESTKKKKPNMLSVRSEFQAFAVLHILSQRRTELRLGLASKSSQILAIGILGSKKGAWSSTLAFSATGTQEL